LENVSYSDVEMFSMADWWIHFYFYSRVDKIDSEFFHLDTIATVFSINKTEGKLRKLIWS